MNYICELCLVKQVELIGTWIGKWHWIEYWNGWNGYSMIVYWLMTFGCIFVSWNGTNWSCIGMSKMGGKMAW